jgi:hypothetical protein
MKTQIIQLDAHDDLISIRDKMSWAKTPRVLLAWPRKGRVGVRPLDLTLLARHARSLGLQLALATRDREIKRSALAQNILVFSSTSDAQKIKWPPAPGIKLRPRNMRLNLRKVRALLTPRPPAWIASPAARLAFFAGGVLAMLILVLAFVPSASIRIKPSVRAQSITLPISAGPDVTRVYLSGNIPARKLSVIIEQSETIKATGKADVPDQKAHGTARFTNLTAAAITIPAGTIVQTISKPAVRFETQRDAKLTSGFGQTVDVPVRAIMPGIESNLPANTLVAIEGDLGTNVTVANSDPLNGGTVGSRAAPSDADRDRLRASLLEKMKASAKDRIQKNLQDGDLLFPATIQIARTVEERFSPPQGGTGAQLSLTLRLEFQAFYASADDLNELARGVLDAAALPGYTPVTDSIVIEPASALFSGPTGATNFQLSATRQMQAAIDPARIVWSARGRKSQLAAQALMEEFQLSTAPQIILSPSWWPWLPLVPFRISISQ